MISYKVPNEIKEVIQKLVDDKMLIGRDNDDIVTIYPDFIQKRKNCVASGVTIESANSIYPCSIPDIGCAFRIIKLAGITKQDLMENDNLCTDLTKLLKGDITYNLISSDKLKDEMLRYGHRATASLFDNRSDCLYEDGGSYSISEKHQFSKEVFDIDIPLEVYNAFQGHFIEMLEDHQEKNVYLFIHSGVETLARRFRDIYYPMLASISYQNGWSSEDAIVLGQFAINIESEIVPMYYNDVKGIMNFAFAYRDLLECRIIEIIKKNVKRNLM